MGRHKDSNCLYEPQYLQAKKILHKTENIFSNKGEWCNCSSRLRCHSKDHQIPYPLTKLNTCIQFQPKKGAIKSQNVFTFKTFFFDYFMMVVSFIVPKQEKENIILIKFW